MKPLTARDRQRARRQYLAGHQDLLGAIIAEPGGFEDLLKTMQVRHRGTTARQLRGDLAFLGVPSSSASSSPALSLQDQRSRGDGFLVSDSLVA